MRINPWVLWTVILFALAFAWGLFAVLEEVVKTIRWRLYVRRYWRTHPRGPIEQWETQRNA
jgi:hypothetical protein